MFIYVHVPFCQSRCIYCDFYVVLEKYGGQDAFLKVLLQEAKQRLLPMQKNASKIPLNSLYIGGGTPSLLGSSSYKALGSEILKYTELQEGSELTIEANPGAMKEDPEAYLDVGFNRISVGVQSFNDLELRRLSRIHNGEEAFQFIKKLQKAGFDNISIDLMYGLPEQTSESWQRTLDKTLELGISHISMYGLKVEEKTPLERLVTMGAYPLPDEEAHVAMYFQGLEALKEGGFVQYEFSNLAQPGRESQHNLNYWNNGEYLALGPSAHGYLNESRYETVRDLKAWVENPLAGEFNPCSKEEQLENALIFGLRKMEGVDIADLEARYHIDFQKRYGAILTKYAPENFFKIEEGRLKLSLSAIPVSNTLLAEFMG